jgi:glutathione S-transferase
MPELLALPFSPYSEKARWALDVRRVPYRYRVYSPLLGEPALRLKVRRLRGAVTVPVLTTDDGHTLTDSTEIARWADGRGDGPVLFPEEHRTTIAHFVALSERALDAGRALNLTRTLRDEEALDELVPRQLRSAGAVARRLAAFGVWRTLRKYGAHRVALEAHRRTVTDALDELRAALARAGEGGGGPRTLLGGLTFADIAASQAVTLAKPPSFGLKLGPGGRRCWTDPEFCDRYADLVAWRDALYDRYRPRPATKRNP